MDLSKGDGWLHLESFLGPERIGPFPKINTADGPRPKQNFFKFHIKQIIRPLQY